MNMNISVVVLAKNESLHICRCIESVLAVADSVYVVDCFSSDGTKELAESLGAVVVQRQWPGLYAPQFNWALDNLPLSTEWVLRLDADEYLSEALVGEIQKRLAGLSEDVSGVSFFLRRVFLGRTIRKGMPPIRMVRLFRLGKGRCEERMMDEHIRISEGRVVEFAGEFVDDNLNDLSWWTQKHVGYAVREAADLLDIEYGFSESKTDSIGKIGAQAARKRAGKTLYARLPLFWRAFAYFLTRYVLRGGFLEGTEGFLWHFFQGWWYRTLVDAKILEIRRKAKEGYLLNSGGNIPDMAAAVREVLRIEYGMKV